MMTGFLRNAKASTKRITFDTHTYIYIYMQIYNTYTYIHQFSILSVIFVCIIHSNVYEFIERLLHIYNRFYINHMQK